VQRLEAHFAKDGVHHDEQADGDGSADADEGPALEGGTDGGDQVAEDDAEGHGQEDPEDEEAVKEGEAFEGGRFRCVAFLLLVVWMVVLAWWIELYGLLF